MKKPYVDFGPNFINSKPFLKNKMSNFWIVRKISLIIIQGLSFLAWVSVIFKSYSNVFKISLVPSLAIGWVSSYTFSTIVLCEYFLYALISWKNYLNINFKLCKSNLRNSLSFVAFSKLECFYIFVLTNNYFSSLKYNVTFVLNIVNFENDTDLRLLVTTVQIITFHVSAYQIDQSLWYLYSKSRVLCNVFRQ